MAEKLKSDTSLKLDQAVVSIKAAKQQARSYTSNRAGYCKALPISPFTSKASESRWALLSKGTESSFIKSCDQTTARPKHSMGDRRLMHDSSNIKPEWALYELPATCPKHGRGLEDLQPIFAELLRLKLLASSEEHELNKQPTLNSKQWHKIKRAAARGQWSECAKVLQQAITLNQVRG